MRRRTGSRSPLRDSSEMPCSLFSYASGIKASTVTRLSATVLMRQETILGHRVFHNFRIFCLFALTAEFGFWSSVSVSAETPLPAREASTEIAEAEKKLLFDI